MHGEKNYPFQSETQRARRGAARRLRGCSSISACSPSTWSRCSSSPRPTSCSISPGRIPTSTTASVGWRCQRGACAPRDRAVFQACRRRRLPLVLTLAGATPGSFRTSWRFTAATVARRTRRVCLACVGSRSSCGASARVGPSSCCTAGPERDHDYLRPGFDALAQGRELIYYDQRGGGRSPVAARRAGGLDRAGRRPRGLAASSGSSTG